MEEILGRVVDIWELRSEDGLEKWWIWKSIVLKMENQNNNGEVSTIYASDINEDIVIPLDFFDIPTNF